jgi:four helix bundle protein
MDAMRTHTDLEVWRRSVDLAAEVYKITQNFPRAEIFGLTGQMRRAAISIASNIAEGAGRRTTKDFICFIHIARGSLAELETQITIAQRVGLGFQARDLMMQSRLVGRLLNGLLRSLRQRTADGASNV